MGHGISRTNASETRVIEQPQLKPQEKKVEIKQEKPIEGKVKYAVFSFFRCLRDYTVPSPPTLAFAGGVGWFAGKAAELYGPILITYYYSRQTQQMGGEIARAAANHISAVYDWAASPFTQESVKDSLGDYLGSWGEDLGKWAGYGSAPLWVPTITPMTVNLCWAGTAGLTIVIVNIVAKHLIRKEKRIPMEVQQNEPPVQGRS